MAKAKVTGKKITIKELTLTLTGDEAQFLTDVFAKISGDVKDSRRKYQVSIMEALHEAGMEFDTHDMTGSISVGLSR